MARIVHTVPTTDLGRFRELDSVPASALDAPNGGALGYRFRLLDADGRTELDWLFSNTTASIDSDDGSGVDFAAALRALLADGDPVDLWLAVPFFGIPVLAPYLDIVRPRVLVPHHWDGAITPPITQGLERAFAPGGLDVELPARGVELVPEQQYLDAFELTRHGVVRIDNADVKRQLGIPPPPASPARDAVELEAG